MKTTNTGRNILCGVSVIIFFIICLSYIQGLIGSFSHTLSFSIFKFKYFTVIVSSIGIIFLLIRKSSSNKFRIWVVLLAIASTIYTFLYFLDDFLFSLRRLASARFILYTLFYSEVLKAIVCIILACICFLPQKSRQYLLILLGVLSCTDICLSYRNSNCIFYEIGRAHV